MPALIVTGDTAPDVVAYIESGRIPYLHKPVNTNQLTKIILQILDASQVNTQPMETA